MAKIDTFLNELDLYDLYNNNPVNVEKMLEHDFKYSIINEIIKQKREKSIGFLRKASITEDGSEQ